MDVHVAGLNVCVMHSEVFHVSIATNPCTPKALWYGNDFTIKHPYVYMHIHKHTRATTYEHMSLCRDRIQEGNVSVFLDRPVDLSFQDVLWDVAEGPQWVLNTKRHRYRQRRFNSSALLKGCTASHERIWDYNHT